MEILRWLSRFKMDFHLFISWLFMLRVIGVTLAQNEHNPYWFVISLNKTATQSSSEPGGGAHLAVDGFAVPKPDSCTLTTSATSMWFAINFGRPMFPAMIVLHSGTGVTYYHVYVRLGDSTDYSSNPVVKLTKIGKFQIITNQHLKGQYLSIHYSSSTEEQVSLCEVYAYWIPIESLSYGKPAEVLETPGVPNQFQASKINDLSWNNLCSSHYLPNSWIRIDLLDIYYVREVVIVQYPGHASSEAFLAIGSSLKNEGKGNPRCDVTNLVLGEAKSFICNLKGRYVVYAAAKLNKKTHTKATEIVVNPTYVDNLAETVRVDTSSREPGYSTVFWATDSNPGSAIVTKDIGSGNWIRIDLGNSYPVAKILLFNIKDQEYKMMMVAFELRVGDSDADNGNSNPLCLPGVHSLVGKQTESYFCEPRVTGRYVNIRQTVDKPVAVAEVAVFSESPPKIKERHKEREMWLKQSDTELTLTCAAHGYPTPVVAWQRDGVIISNSDTLTVGESGTYECLANNTHGVDFKPVEVRITSEIRVCVGSIEVSYDLGGSNTGIYPKADQEFHGHKWYRFSDTITKQYLQLHSNVPNLKKCQTKMSGKHPGLSEGVVERSVCVRDEMASCKQRIKVRVRNCGAYFVYNFPSTLEVKGFAYCFRTANKPSGNPGIASTVGGPNMALSNHVLQREEDIQDSTDCSLMCSVSQNCKSFNFSRKEKICELNSSTRRENPKDFVSRDGFNYFAKGKGLVARRVDEL